jgi:hypothetical protein
MSCVASFFYKNDFLGTFPPSAVGSPFSSSSSLAAALSLVFSRNSFWRASLSSFFFY